MNEKRSVPFFRHRLQDGSESETDEVASQKAECCNGNRERDHLKKTTFKGDEPHNGDVIVEKPCDNDGYEQ